MAQFLAAANIFKSDNHLNGLLEFFLVIPFRRGNDRRWHFARCEWSSLGVRETRANRRNQAMRTSRKGAKAQKREDANGRNDLCNIFESERQSNCLRDFFLRLWFVRLSLVDLVS